MAPSIYFLIDTPTAPSAFAAELNRLLDIDLLPADPAGQTYAFRAMTLTFDLQPIAAADAPPPHQRYAITINGIFGSEEQRTKWTEDWAFGILQKLKALPQVRVKRVNSL